MNLLVLLLLIALIFGIGGLLTGLKWLLIIGGIILLIGLLTGYRRTY